MGTYKTAAATPVRRDVRLGLRMALAWAFVILLVSALPATASHRVVSYGNERYVMGGDFQAHACRSAAIPFNVGGVCFDVPPDGGVLQLVITDHVQGSRVGGVVAFSYEEDGEIIWAPVGAPTFCGETTLSVPSKAQWLEVVLSGALFGNPLFTPNCGLAPMATAGYVEAVFYG